MSLSPNVVVLILTFLRPSALGRLLGSIGMLNYSGAMRVVVVDNDPAGSARAVALSCGLPVEYFVEPIPGIAAARNRALDAVSEQDEYVAMVDDDEVVSNEWMNALVDAAVRFEADIVAGPVVSRFPARTPEWLLRGRFYVRREYSTGSVRKSAAGGNALVRKSALEQLGSPRFDESFSLTGGEDSEFFGRLAKLGARIVWCAEALAFEYVEQSRVTAREVARRGLRAGTTRGRLLRRKHATLVVFVYGVLQAGWGLVRAIVGLLRWRFVRAADVNPALDGVGIVMACVGREVFIYGRGR